MALEFYFLIRLSDNLRIQHFWKLEVLPPFPESNSVKVLERHSFNQLGGSLPTPRVATKGRIRESDVPGSRYYFAEWKFE